MWEDGELIEEFERLLLVLWGHTAGALDVELSHQVEQIGGLLNLVDLLLLLQVIFFNLGDVKGASCCLRGHGAEYRAAEGREP